MSGVEAIVELLPRIAALPSREDLESYRLTSVRAAGVRRELCNILLDSVPHQSLFPSGSVRSKEQAKSLLEQNQYSLSQVQRRSETESFNGTSPSSSSVHLTQPEYSVHRRGMACGHVFRKGEPIFRCRDCSYDDTCVQCSTCFENSIHQREQHDIVFSLADESGACCDCGDVEAWKCDLRCEYHSLHPLSFGDHTETLGSEPETLQELYSHLPESSRNAITQFVDMLLVFLLEVLTLAEQRRAPSLGPDIVEDLKRMPTLERAFDVMELAKNSDSCVLPQVFTALLWNDERHSFNEVSDKIMEVKPNLSAQAARLFAEHVDRHGREVLAVLSEPRRLVKMARRINIHGLLVTIQPAFDFYVQEVAGVVLEFLVDLTSCALYSDGEHVDGRAWKVIMAHLFLTPWHNASWETASSTIAREIFDPSKLCKLDALLLLDARMWKKARLDVRAAIMDTIACREAKQAIGVRFAYVYPRLIETFILHDREPEHSIYHIAVQLFSVPSVASELVLKHGTLRTMLSILQALFASESHGRLTHLTLPPPSSAEMQANPSAALLGQSKCYRVFHDTRYLLSPQDVQKDIARHSQDYMQPWLAFFALFHGIGPDTRAVHAHVEFESELWHQLFLMSSHLGHIAKLLGEAFKHATPQQRNEALAFVSQKMLDHIALLETIDPLTHKACAAHVLSFPTESSGASAPCITAPVTEFVVARDPVSFHHPMHWLLAEMLKSLSGEDVVSRAAIPEPTMFALLEHPLRVVVKLAQIRCNTWVRNGYGLRLQAFHYRDSMWMRDIMYDQDLFLLQCALAFVEQERFLLTLMDRFDLVDWFSGQSQEHEVYDAEQATAMAEELLLLLATLLSEINIAVHRPIEQQVRRELIHYLALGSNTYSEVTKQIPERYTDHNSLDRELAQIATFRAPDGTTDVGMYELRPEYYAQVQPFFHHYSRNQRERAEEVLAERRAKGDTSIRLIPPEQLHVLRATPFANLSNVFTETTFVQMVTSALGNAVHISTEAPSDTLLSVVTFLVSLGVAERGGDFIQKIVQDPVRIPRRNQQSGTLEFVPTTLWNELLGLVDDTRVSALHAKLQCILEAGAELNQEAASSLMQRRASNEAATSVHAMQGSGASDSEAARRQAARERQAAIMQQFSEQQKNLLASLEEELSDDEENLVENSSEDFGTCILCQERLDTHRAFGTLMHLQESRVVRTTPPREHAVFQELFDLPMDMNRANANGDRVQGNFKRYEPSSDPTKPPIALGYPAEHHVTGIVGVTCGHSMHVECFQTYMLTTEQRHATQVARNHPEDLSRLEFVCPLCKGLGNTLLPMPGSNSMSRSLFSDQQLGSVSFDDQPLTEWVRRINIAILKNTSASVSARAEHQEHERGTGCFFAFYVPEAAHPQNADLQASFFKNNDEREMLQRTRSVLQLLAYDTKWIRAKDRRATILEHPTDGSLADAIYLPENVVGYTLAQLEISQRGIQSPGPSVASAVSEQSVLLVRSLLEVLQGLARIACKDDAKCADAMRQGLLKRLMPHWAGEHVVRSPLLLRNVLGVLVEAAVLMPQHLLHVTALLYYVTLVQTVFGLAQPAFVHGERRRAEEANIDNAEALSIFPHARWLVTSIVNLVGYVRGNITLGFDHCSDQDLAKLLCVYTLPFLRRAALLHRIVGGDSVMQDFPPNLCEYRRLLLTLRIPEPSEALPIHMAPAGLIAMLVEGWTKHAYVHLVPLFRPLPILPDLGEARATVPNLVLEHPHIYELVPLPLNLANLLQETQRRTCKRCHTLPPLSSLCLFCGELLCDQSFCCSDLEDEGRGECHQHMEHCGGRLGAHFRVGSNMIVLLFERNGCFTSSPYLNSHGEVDHALLKARPLRLFRQRYDELRRQWLLHGIANMVTRRTESNVGIGGWTTI
ncbi:RING-type E3 ubiquitin transferase [Malassezia psittaci]|uniref:E3 ubiquitin-protein ligase n=1 Tax=Malassezia psittaci TaxID=1821823 RepID=A0AAF0JC19_9BASI|nr:RING-type E3 ubiquitin transferase [Malassezia psittaci]